MDAEKMTPAELRKLADAKERENKPVKDKFLLRSERKAINRKHIRNASLPVKMIKLADRIDNLKTLENAPPEFRKTYWEESVLLRQVLAMVHPILEEEIDDILLNFKF